MTTENQTTAEQDGVCHGIATACVSAIRDAANNASPERFIRLAVQQAEQSGGFSTERVAGILHATLRGINASSVEIQGAVCKGCAAWEEVEGQMCCCNAVYWRDGIPDNPECYFTE